MCLNRSGMQPQNDPYNFIMNPDTGPQKKSLLPGGGLNLSKKQMIIFGAGGLLTLSIIITLLFSFLNSGPTNKDDLISVAQKQNELIRVSEIAIKEATGTQARNLAMTTKLSLQSDQSYLIASLKAQKIKIGSKELKGAESSETTEKMTDAKQNNRFDEVYLEYIQEALVDYQRSLNVAYKSTVSTKHKETMKVQYENASLIIGVDPEV